MASATVNYFPPQPLRAGATVADDIAFGVDGHLMSNTLGEANFTAGTYWNGSAWVQTYVNSALYIESGGAHKWYSGTGAVGANTSLSLRMFLDTSGNLSIGGFLAGNGASGAMGYGNVTAPSGGTAGGVVAFANSNNLKAVTPSGNVVTLASDTKPTVTGSRAANAALASLLTTLATLGILTDSSTA